MLNQLADLEARLAQAQTRREKIDALNELAWELRNSDKARMRLLSNQAYELATTGEFAAQPYPLGAAASLRALALWNIRDGEFNLAASKCKQALAILETTPQPVLRTDALTILARAYWGLGDYAVALDCALDALKLTRENGAQDREAYALDVIGNIHAEMRQFEIAINAHQDALQIYRRMEDKYGESLVLNNLADTYLISGNLDDALNTGLESLRVAQANGVSQIEMASLGTIGEIYLARQDYDHAATYLQQALALSQQRGSKHLGLTHRMNLGVIARIQNDITLAMQYFDQALAIAGEIGERSTQAQCYEHIAKAYEQQGDYQKAYESYKQFHVTKESVFNGNYLPILPKIC